MMKNVQELNYFDSIATLRMIKTLDMESRQKRLLTKLHKNVTDSFRADISDPIKSIERAKDIFKVNSIDLHKQLL